MYLEEQERERVCAEYRRRERELPADLYAPWQPGEMLMRSERKRIAASMLQTHHVFPTQNCRCLEIGYGSLGWLGELISWGVPTKNLFGIELDCHRAQCAQQRLPAANLYVGDARDLPWPDQAFELVVVSTVFSSILDSQIRQAICSEMQRVLAPGGAILWYDLAVNNPRNSQVKKVGRREIESYFPGLQIHLRSVTLMAPLARALARRSWLLAELTAAVPVLRTHWLGLLIKPRPAIARPCESE